MKPKKIYLLRHGETDHNKTGVVQGSGVDSSLNQNGLKQARLFFEVYKDYPFDIVYTSALRRTIQTIQGFIDKGIPHVKLSGLNEISWGKAEGVPFNEDTNNLYLQTIEEWKKGRIDLAFEGGETPLELKARQEDAIKSIVANDEVNNVLVCMHGRAMKILLAWLMDYPIEEMDVFLHENLSLYILNFDGENFEIERSNDVAHLKGFKSEVKSI
ncbi:histidine phosphatase family protein [Bacteroidota bacterium]